MNINYIYLKFDFNAKRELIDSEVKSKRFGRIVIKRNTSDPKVCTRGFDIGRIFMILYEIAHFSE